MEQAQRDRAWATGLSHPRTCNLHGGSLVLAHMCRGDDLYLTLWEAGHIQTLGSYYPDSCCCLISCCYSWQSKSRKDIGSSKGEEIQGTQVWAEVVKGPSLEIVRIDVAATTDLL